MMMLAHGVSVIVAIYSLELRDATTLTVDAVGWLSRKMATLSFLSTQLAVCSRCSANRGYASNHQKQFQPITKYWVPSRRIASSCSIANSQSGGGPQSTSSRSINGRTAREPNASL